MCSPSTPAHLRYTPGSHHMQSLQLPVLFFSLSFEQTTVLLICPFNHTILWKNIQANIIHVCNMHLCIHERHIYVDFLYCIPVTLKTDCYSEIMRITLSCNEPSLLGFVIPNSCKLTQCLRSSLRTVANVDASAILKLWDLNISQFICVFSWNI